MKTAFFIYEFNFNYKNDEKKKLDFSLKNFYN